MPPSIKGFIESSLLDWEGKARRHRLPARLQLPVRLLPRPAPRRAGALRRSDPARGGPRSASAGSAAGSTASSSAAASRRSIRTSWTSSERFRAAGHRRQARHQRQPARTRSNDLLRLGALDYVAMDVKAPLDGQYSEVARVPVDLDAIRRSIDLLIGGNTPCEFRTTVCPGLLDADDIEPPRSPSAARRSIISRPSAPSIALTATWRTRNPTTRTRCASSAASPPNTSAAAPSAATRPANWWPHQGNPSFHGNLSPKSTIGDHVAINRQCPLK